MPIDWKSSENNERLLAAVVASMSDSKLDMNRIAALYGQGATYNTIEGRMRSVKRTANALRDDLDKKDCPAGMTQETVGGNGPKKTTKRKADATAGEGPITKKHKQMDDDDDNGDNGEIAH